MPCGRFHATLASSEMSWMVETIRGSLYEELAVRIVHVLDGGLEEVARQKPGLLLDLARGHRQRRPTDRGRAAAAGAPPHRRVVRVAVHDLHVRHGEAELVGDDLRERRLFALAVRGRADEHVHFPARVDTNDRAFPETALESHRTRDLRRPEPADFDVGRDADAEVAALLARRCLLTPEILVPDVRQRFVERSW